MSKHKQAAIDLLESQVWIQAVQDADRLCFEAWTKLSSEEQAMALTTRMASDGYIQRALRIIADA